MTMEVLPKIFEAVQFIKLKTRRTGILAPSMPRTIKVFEHEQLKIHANARGEKLEEHELSKLYEFNDQHGSQYFIGIRDGVKFTSYVGVIQIGGLTLEILPKADRYVYNKEDHKIATTRWRNVLLQMLAITQRIPVESVSEASLEKRHHSIIDLYFQFFLNEVQKLLHRGLAKKYRSASGNLPVLKGRLDFNRNIQQNLIHRERFYTDHHVYDQDHLLNQILLRALVILDRITTSPFIKDKLARTLLDFPEVKQIHIQKHHFDCIIENRKTIPYREALKIARMIILNYSPDIKGGGENMLALLFDMNKLWEEYIYRSLLRVKPGDVTINFQNSKTFWQSESLRKTIRPDLVIRRGSEIFVIDTKWKIINSLNPDDDDLKQIFTYNLYWRSYHSILLYPSTSCEFPSHYGKYHEGFDSEHGCSLAFVEVLNETGALNKNCGEFILELASRIA
ncbi:MAG: restriction endonuclease [Azospira oryzae]|nr:MAG: restriction endonuclease [Azospira oryzae]